LRHHRRHHVRRRRLLARDGPEFERLRISLAFRQKQAASGRLLLLGPSTLRSIDEMNTVCAMLPDQSDDDLMLRYRDGELSAFQELYRRHSRGLYRFLAWRS